MPPKNCGSCQKMVYPMDELKCLDKTWHKSCFKCQECGMKLNMKNYKGYNKLPYCNAHYPTTKFTAVAETPEMKRIAQNTKLQSNINYHADFEASKGQYTAVADDPETLRVRKNMQTISNVAYHGDMMRKQEMENARPNEIESTDEQQKSAPVQQTDFRRSSSSKKPGSISDYDPTASDKTNINKTQASTEYNSKGPAYRAQRIGSITDYDPINDHYGSIVGQYTEPKKEKPGEEPKTGEPAPAFTPPIAAQRSINKQDEKREEEKQEPQPRDEENDHQQKTDSQEMSHDQGEQSPDQEEQSSDQKELSYNHQQSRDQEEQSYDQQESSHDQQEQSRDQREQSRDQREQSHDQREQKHDQQEQSHDQQEQSHDQQEQSHDQQEQSHDQQEQSHEQQEQSHDHDQDSGDQGEDDSSDKGNMSRALYDYTAGDDDEVSFNENDLIINCNPIDEGWMMGTVEKSGHQGMLPSNYVEKVNW